MDPDLRMEEEDDDDDDDNYAAMMVDTTDLESVDMEIESSNLPYPLKVPELGKLRVPVTAKKSTVVSIVDTEIEEQEEQPSTSTGSVTSVRRLTSSSQNPEEDFRRAATQYLQGELSIHALAAAVEDCGELVRDDDISDADQSPEKQPSFVLIDASKIDSSQGHEKHGTSRESETQSKIRDDFYHSGDNTTTFSVRVKRKMPPTIKSMMGEAHVRFARGDLQAAEKICLEIIKEQPTYKDPYHTLGMVYESQGKVRESLQFFLISGLLDPKKFEEWPRLADLSLEEGNLSQAIMCLTKALVTDPTNVKAYLKRSELLLSSGDLKGAKRGYHKILNLLMSSGDGVTYLNVAKTLAGLYYENGELSEALTVLVNAAVKFHTFVTTVEVNLLIELCIASKRYVKAIMLFLRFAGVEFEPPLPKSCFRERNMLTNALNACRRQCAIPHDLHADLLQKLCIVLIHLEAFNMASPILQSLMENEDLEEFGLQFYEIAEAYLAKQQYQACLEILQDIIKTPKFCEAAEIWLRYAECLYLIKNMEEAADAYSKVISLAPGHKVARLNLSVILQKLGKYDTALESLGYGDIEDFIDQDLMVEKCNILLSRNRIRDFYETAMKLFSRHSPQILDRDEVIALMMTSQTNQMLEALKLLRKKKGVMTEAQSLDFSLNSGESPIGEWTVYLNLIKTLLKINRIDLFCRVVYTVWASPFFNQERRMKRDMDLHCAYAAMLSCDSELTKRQIRTLIMSYGISPIVIALIGLAARRCGHTKYIRQTVRLLMKRPNDSGLMMLSANNSFMNGTYKYCLMEYLALIKLKPYDPLIYLMTASTMIHIASQKHTTNKSQLILQAVAFINKYAELRGECQEVYYNLGRFYHFLGMTKKALELYKLVLTTDPVDDSSNSNYNISDLKMEAAFNISQIYKSMSCWNIAKQYIHRYIVI